jgi:hypothetical protein
MEQTTFLKKKGDFKMINALAYQKASFPIFKLDRLHRISHELNETIRPMLCSKDKREVIFFQNLSQLFCYI